MFTAELPTYIDRQTLACEFIDQREHPECPTIQRPEMHEVITPHMIFLAWSEPHT